MSDYDITISIVTYQNDKSILKRILKALEPVD